MVKFFFICIISSVLLVASFPGAATAGPGTADIFFSQNGRGAVARSVVDKLRDFVTVKDFGAIGDGVVDDTASIQAAIDYGAANKIKVRIFGGNYKLLGQLTTKSNLHLEFDNGAWLFPHAWSATGAIITNVHSTDDAARIQSNIYIDNPQIDGQYLNYDGRKNDNAIGFARGASLVRINGGVIKNFKFSWTGSGAGGKAVNFESGVVDSMITGLTAENCGVAVFIQGYHGTHRNGAEKNSSRILVSNIIAKNCETAIAIFGINLAQDPDGDPNDQLVIVDGVTFYNCGHAPNRPVGSSYEKSGVIVLGEAQNVQISNVKGYNSPNYPASWPARGSGLVGSGLSGPIGAVIWGWGRNISISNVEYHGNSDALIQVNRARALGDDAAGDGVIENVFRFDVDGLRHYGTANYVLDIQAGALAPTNTNVSGYLSNIFVDNLVKGFVSQNMAGFTGFYLSLNNTSIEKKFISGTAHAILAGKNNFSASSSEISYPNQTLEAYGYRGLSFTMTDDSSISFKPPTTSGVLVISSETSLLRAIVGFRANASPQSSLLGPAIPNFSVTTGELTGVTGADASFTVSTHKNGKIYLENRRGESVTVNVVLLM